MKKILSLVIAAVMMLAVFTLCASAEAQPVLEIAQDVTFFDKDGNTVTPGEAGAGWGLFTYWTGFDGTQIYDNNSTQNGTGWGVKTTVNCKGFYVYFGNGDGNCNNNVDIFVDGIKVGTYNPYTSGTTVNCTSLFEVTPGVHELKIVATGGEGWQGAPFNCFAYIGNYEWTNGTDYNYSEGWGDFTYWNGYNDTPIKDNHGKDQTVEATVTGNKIMVVFGNCDSNCDNNIDILVDGTKVGTLNPSKMGNKFGNCPYAVFTVATEGQHTVKMVANGSESGEGWQGSPLNGFFGAVDSSLVKKPPETADITSVFALIAVISLGGVALATKKH